jgi:hypothetical protein
MPLCSAAQIATLKNWHFIPDYQKYRNELLGVASTVYHGVWWAKKAPPPTPAQCEEPLALALHASPGFGRLLRSSLNLYPHHYKQFETAMAQYLLDTFWFDIQHI